MKDLPLDYIIAKFLQYSGYPKYNKGTRTYSAGCPVCHEDSSWGKKRRCFLLPNKQVIYCQNCQRSWAVLNWIKEVGSLSYAEIMEELKDFNSVEFAAPIQEKKQVSETLPQDSINLFDHQQIDYYKDNQVVKDALDFVKMRRLDTLCNKPKGVYISLKDYIHKNRVCLPFYDSKGDIPFYQTRAIYKKDEIDRPKYLSKVGDEKTIFGLNNIDTNLDYLFIFEGPIDSCSVVSGIAMAGISLTEKQEQQLNAYTLFQKIWVLDNQLDNKEVKKKMTSLIDTGERVFIWPEKFKEYKDINDICTKFKLDQISPEFFIKNSFRGVEAQIRISK